MLVLGSGGTSKTVQTALEQLHAGEVRVVSRRPGPGQITYEQAVTDHADAAYIVNTTPVGMHPHTEASPLDLTPFCQCQGVIDVIYHPLRTRLLLQAAELGIPAANGLLMLVAQAKYASERFQGRRLANRLIAPIQRDLLAQLSNVVLLGMPGSGKSTFGKRLSSQLKRRLIDTDQVIVQQTGLRIPEIFARYGEAHFRRLEAEAVAQAALETGVVIATGGGVVVNPENVRRLRQNGVLIFLDRNYRLLEGDPNRPLAADKAAIAQRYQERYPLYRAACQARIVNNDNFATALWQIKERFYEHLSD